MNIDNETKVSPSGKPKRKTVLRLGVICLLGGVAIVALLGSLYVYRVPVRLEVYPGNRYKIVTAFIWPTLRSNLDDLPKNVDIVSFYPDGTRVDGLVWWNTTDLASRSLGGLMPFSVQRIWGSWYRVDREMAHVEIHFIEGSNYPTTQPGESFETILMTLLPIRY